MNRRRGRNNRLKVQTNAHFPKVHKCLSRVTWLFAQSDATWKSLVHQARSNQNSKLNYIEHTHTRIHLQRLGLLMFKCKLTLLSSCIICPRLRKQSWDCQSAATFSHVWCREAHSACAITLPVDGSRTQPIHWPYTKVLWIFLYMVQYIMKTTLTFMTDKMPWLVTGSVEMEKCELGSPCTMSYWTFQFLPPGSSPSVALTLPMASASAFSTT